MFYRSGASIPPYDYNGFVAKLEFVDRITTTETTPVVSQATLRNPNRIPSSSEKSSKRCKHEGFVFYAYPASISTEADRNECNTVEMLNNDDISVYVVLVAFESIFRNEKCNSAEFQTRKIFLNFSFFFSSRRSNH